MFRKSITGGIILLFLFASIIPFVSSNEISTNNILYVDDDGTADYIKIQDAIDNASEGDTVFVYNGIYYENVVVDKTLSLIGEDRNSTIIDGNLKDEHVIKITADTVKVTGFKVGNVEWDLSADYGIYIKSNNNLIYENNLDYKIIDYGIAIRGNNNEIKNNYFEGRRYFGVGISLVSSYNNIIDNNHIKKHMFGMKLESCTVGASNLIINNTIEQQGEYGIFFYSPCSNVEVTKNNVSYCNDDYPGAGVVLKYKSCNNSIHKNLINYNAIGILIKSDDNNENRIYNNSFLYNDINAKDGGNNIWDDGKKGNYWDDYKRNYPFAHRIWSKGIWSTPYEIPGGNNQDRYPLIKPSTESESYANLLLLRFLENHPYLFPLLHQLLRL